MQVLDGQFQPSKFRNVFGYSMLYVTAFLTIPSSLMTYLSYPYQTYDVGTYVSVRTTLESFFTSMHTDHEICLKGALIE